MVVGTWAEAVRLMVVRVVKCGIGIAVHFGLYDDWFVMVGLQHLV